MKKIDKQIRHIKAMEKYWGVSKETVNLMVNYLKRKRSEESFLSLIKKGHRYTVWKDGKGNLMIADNSKFTLVEVNPKKGKK